MTVATETSAIVFTGIVDGVALNVPFPVQAATDLKVRYGALDTLATPGTHYTVALVPPDYLTATVTPLVGFAATSGGTVSVRREIPYTQPTDIPTQATLASSRLEQMFDRIVFMCQQVRDLVTYTLRFPTTDTTVNIAALPPAADRALKYLAFDVQGRPVAAAAQTGTTPMTAFGTAWAAMANGAAAVTYLFITATSYLSRLLLGSHKHVNGVTDYGMLSDADGGVNNSAALLAALNDAETKGVNLYIPGGTYTCSTAVAKTLTKRLRLFGDDRDVTVLKFTGSGGLSLTYSGQTKAPIVERLSIETTAANGGDALTITCSPALATAYAIGPIVRDFGLKGVDTATDNWTNGVHFVDCWYPVMRDFYIKGRDDATTPFDMLTGVKYTRCMGLMMNNFTMQHVHTGVAQAGTTLGEGLNVSEFEIVGVNAGLDLTSALGAVPIQGIQNGHINAYQYGLNLKNIVQGNYSGLLIYKTHVSTTAFVGINCDAVDNSNIDAQILAAGTGVTSGGMTGVVLTNSDYNKVSCRFDQWEAAGSGVVVGTNSKGNILTNNIGGNLGSAINVAVLNADAGANNLVESNVASGSGVAVTNNSTVQQVIRDNAPLQVQLLTANSTTPSVRAAKHDKWRTNNSAATTITGFTDGVIGQSVRLHINDANTGFTHNALTFILNGGANIAVGTGAGHVIVFDCVDTGIWVEASRSF